MTHPHSTLRYTAKAVKRVDAEFKDRVQAMFDLMYAAKGIGLAANQVDWPVRVFVMNLESNREKGKERVFINPVIGNPKGSEEAEEGCLSLPGLYGNVVRPKQVRIQAYDLQGNEIDEELTGLAARCVQHEVDHLNGVMFVDRMNKLSSQDVLDQLYEFELDFESRRKTGAIPSEEAIAAAREEWERRYC